MPITCRFYRQSQIFGREGLDLDRSTLADWVGKTTALLEPLADAIGRHVLSAEAILADDTPISMLAPGTGTGTGKTQTARLWTYARDERPWGGDAPPAAWYRFSGGRKGQHPKRHLARFRGWMHADGHAGLIDLYRSGAIREVACMAARRRQWRLNRWRCHWQLLGSMADNGSLRRKFVDIRRIAGLPDRRRGHQTDRPALCRRERGQRLPARPSRRTAPRACRPGLR